MRHFPVYLLFLLLSPTLGAQQTVTFEVEPAAAFVRINGEVLDLLDTTSLDLPTGTYQAEIWAPGFRTNKRSVTVGERDVTVRYELTSRSADYEDYQYELSNRNARVVKRAVMDVTFIGATAGATYLAITGRNERLDELEATVADRTAAYRAAVSPSELRDIRREYNAAVQEHEDVQASHNLITVVSTAVAVTGAYFTYRRFFRGKRGEYPRPEYTPTNPFTGQTAPGNTGTDLELGVRGTGVGMTLRF